MALTRRQQVFAHEYLIDLNATRAAIRAGYSARSARAHGNRMMTNDDISEFIDNSIAERLERLGITADRVLQEWATIGFASMGDFLTSDEHGCPAWDFEDATRFQSAAIRDISIHTGSRGRRITIKLADKPSALLVLSKYVERAMAASSPEALPPPSLNGDNAS
jgi:phage terminase small subunit